MKVAFLDHHLNNYHANKFLELVRGPLKDEGLEVVAAWESNPTGDDWCTKNNVKRAASADEAVKGVDAIMVLAPDNIGEHLKLCSVALPTGKPTVIDKFLAPNLHDAREIVDNAKRHGTPFFSSSSLRYAVELEELLPQIKAANSESCYVRGMGNWSGYGIHTLAPALRMMGHGVKRVIDTGIPGASAITLDYGDRRANLEVREAKNGYEFFSWTFGAKVGDSYIGGTVKKYDEFYANLMKHSAGFFKTGKVDMPMDEALAAVAILEAGEKSKGEWVKVG